jgi:hypothetical protein
MNTKKEIEKLPLEIHDKFGEARACELCMNAAIAGWFGYRKALYFAKKKVKVEREAWDMVKELFPETRTGKWSYSLGSKTIRQLEE